MKNGSEIVLAASLGVLIGLGIYGFKRFFKKRNQDYDDYYSDFHRHFDKRYREETAHGVEYLSMM
ncbi:hypothetical protein [Chryseobacterium sp. MFBS3-17]|uniref:hypothetical protein n=1 Tax=Chryseobacterium sp. MFBS3-17 TaxID=2886689 RepID=UPI001D0E0EE0|nr:hypothetical protein [Chryseobacterium sp. MFBS3-17]MCC2591252.1 hypothetical protein [Chryseobacterium sp. MFBS3-17]